MAQAKSHVPWVRILVEAGAIVLSILLAFGIDAWWERRGLAEDLNAALRTVREEFEQNRDGLAFQLHVERQILSSIDELVEALESAAGPTVAVSDTIVAAAMFWAPTFDPPTGALDALISSGRADRIPDPRLRSLVGAWPSAIADLREEQVGARAVVSEQLWTPLLASFDYRAPIQRSNEFWKASSSRLRPGNESSAQEQLEVSSITVPAQRRIINGLMLNRYWVNSVVAELELIEDQLEEILRLLDVKE